MQMCSRERTEFLSYAYALKVCVRLQEPMPMHLYQMKLPQETWEPGNLYLCLGTCCILSKLQCYGLEWRPNVIKVHCIALKFNNIKNKKRVMLLFRKPHKRSRSSRESNICLPGLSYSQYPSISYSYHTIFVMGGTLLSDLSLTHLLHKHI